MSNVASAFCIKNINLFFRKYYKCFMILVCVKNEFVFER